MAHPRGTTTPAKRQTKTEDATSDDVNDVDESQLWDDPLPSPVAEADGAAITVTVAKVPTTKVAIEGKDIHFRTPSVKTMFQHINLFARVTVDIRTDDQTVSNTDPASYQQAVQNKVTDLSGRAEALDELWHTIVYPAISDPSERAHVDKLINDSSNDDSWTIGVTSGLIRIWSPYWQKQSRFAR